MNELLSWFGQNTLAALLMIACVMLAIAANPESRHDYAELLLQLSSKTSNGVLASVLAVGAGNVATFERRLKMILSSNVSGKLSWSGALAMAVLAVSNNWKTLMIRFRKLAMPHFGQPLADSSKASMHDRFN